MRAGQCFLLTSGFGNAGGKNRSFGVGWMRDKENFWMFPVPRNRKSDNLGVDGEFPPCRTSCKGWLFMERDGNGIIRFHEEQQIPPVSFQSENWDGEGITCYMWEQFRGLEVIPSLGGSGSDLGDHCCPYTRSGLPAPALPARGSPAARNSPSPTLPARGSPAAWG